MSIPVFKRTLLWCECCGRENVEPAGMSICVRCDRMLTKAADYRMENDMEQTKLSGWS